MNCVINVYNYYKIKFSVLKSLLFNSINNDPVTNR